MSCPGCDAAVRTVRLGADVLGVLQKSWLRARIVLVVLSEECDCASNVLVQNASVAREAAAMCEQAAKKFDDEERRPGLKPN